MKSEKVRELVKILMESEVYFELPLRERYILIKQILNTYSLSF